MPAAVDVEWGRDLGQNSGKGVIPARINRGWAVIPAVRHPPSVDLLNTNSYLTLVSTSQMVPKLSKLSQQPDHALSDNLHFWELPVNIALNKNCVFFAGQQYTRMLQWLLIQIMSSKFCDEEMQRLKLDYLSDLFLPQ